MKKRAIIPVLILVAILTAGAVSASEDNVTSDNLLNTENIDIKTISASNDEIISVESDSEILSANSSTYSNLAAEIGSGGNIELMHNYYTYDSGSTIEISTPDSVIDGKGAVIDMAGSTIQSFYISASGVTIKNLTIKNANYDGNGGAVYFEDKGTVINCKFNNNTVDEGAGGAVYFNSYGNVTNCNFTNNTATSGSAININKGTVINCIFNNNNVIDGDGGDGGAVYFEDKGTVINCKFNNNVDEVYGFAVYFKSNGNVTNCNFNNSGTISSHNSTVTNCIFTNNTSIAIDIYGSGTVTNCTFTNNTDCAIRIEDNGNVTNCTFIHNTGDDYAVGGAIHFGYDSISFVDNCNFVNNIVDYDGGAICGGSCTVTNCNFTNNTAVNNGGAISINDGTVTNCTFTNNRADYRGGAIYSLASDNIIVTNCSFTGCSADSLGGAIYYINGFKGSISNCSFTDCSAEEGGALYLPDGADVKITQSTFKNNNAYNGEVISGGIVFDCILDKSSTTSTNNYAVIVPEVVISDDDGFVTLKFPKDAEGTVEVFINETSVAVVKIVNGIAKIDLSNYKGEYTLTYQYSGDENYNSFIKTSKTTIIVIPAKITAANVKMLYTAGQKYKITVYKEEGIIAANAAVIVKISSKSLKVANTNKKGVTSFKVTQTPGTYKLTIKSLNRTVTKTLTVKHLVTLKKVTVKRSAKKLVLTATLAKVNKKYLKNKKITFKFNGKKYTAKTNKNGIAKVTIKKSVLKKLKKGKKVTYQATYLKDTVKQTVKVK